MIVLRDLFVRKCEDRIEVGTQVTLTLPVFCGGFSGIFGIFFSFSFGTFLLTLLDLASCQESMSSLVGFCTYGPEGVSVFSSSI